MINAKTEKTYQNGRIIYKNISKRLIKSELPIEKKYFTLFEIAKMISESIAVTRSWAYYFELGNSSNGKNRKYTRSDIAKFQMAKVLVREELYTMQGAKIKLQKFYGN